MEILVFMGVIFGIISCTCASEDSALWSAIFGVIAFFLVVFGGAGIKQDALENDLLKACPEQARVVSEREFTCTVPVQVRIKDGKVGEVTYGDKKPSPAK